MGKAKVYYSVKPRYTPGSPCANVSEALARQVADEEKRGYERSLTGCYGETVKLDAEQKGLMGIAEAVTERRSHWDVTDLITGESFRREFPSRARVRR